AEDLVAVDAKGHAGEHLPFAVAHAEVLHLEHRHRGHHFFLARRRMRTAMAIEFIASTTAISVSATENGRGGGTVFTRVANWERGTDRPPRWANRLGGMPESGWGS